MRAEYWGGLVLLICSLLLIYHHLIYPWGLARLAARQPLQPSPLVSRGWQRQINDSQLPYIEVLMPAFNESRFIADKLRNLALLDYPVGRWHVVLLLDGCNDSTGAIVRRVLQEPELASLPVQVREFNDNRGKIYRLNQALEVSTSPLLLFTDVSALLPVDSLLAVAAHFSDDQVGAVSLGYRLLQAGCEGEASYWQYQTRIKQQESRLGCLQGAHGAAWALRRKLYQVLPGDTINDDFILPMGAAAQGYRVVYEDRLQALELETIDAASEQQRRQRIGAGNAQQAWRLRGLLHPRHGRLALMFASGKVLRVLMPFCLLLMLFCTLLLAPLHAGFAMLAGLQLMGYATLLLVHWLHITLPFRALRLIDYLLCGHWANLLGSLQYLTGQRRGSWQRAEEQA
ncbi:glycosyltransferase family 2 protein [Pseudomonas sp.]|jgi:cellulose synthase/poly-beta-1,6-N-acetylglucosamine synthase-like glycosyltransferase|uniref:glycosyltransferase family 2 protein n=1 Tax=Pseudomonas sp. TaxID=306 RepID=UPI0037CC66EA